MAALIPTTGLHPYRVRRHRRDASSEAQGAKALLGAAAGKDQGFSPSNWGEKHGYPLVI